MSFNLPNLVQRRRSGEPQCSAVDNMEFITGLTKHEGMLFNGVPELAPISPRCVGSGGNAVRRRHCLHGGEFMKGFDAFARAAGEDPPRQVW